MLGINIVKHKRVFKLISKNGVITWVVSECMLLYTYIKIKIFTTFVYLLDSRIRNLKKNDILLGVVKHLVKFYSVFERYIIWMIFLQVKKKRVIMLTFQEWKDLTPTRIGVRSYSHFYKIGVQNKNHLCQALGSIYVNVYVNVHIIFYNW